MPQPDTQQTTTGKQQIRENATGQTALNALVSAFLLDRKAQNLTPRTVTFYGERLGVFCAFCVSQGIQDISEVTPDVLRAWLLNLAETHNPGGVLTFYRTLRAFLRWYQSEFDPPGWRNPIEKVRPPKNPLEPLEPIPAETLRALLSACKGETFTAARDRAVILCLFDTGVRAGELLALNVEDVDALTGSVLVRQGKGRKPRTVYAGRVTRRALRNYLKHRQDTHPALFVTAQDRTRLTYNGLRQIILRRARQAGVKPPTLHAFRRTFALTMLRAGVDVFSLQRLLGHASLDVLRRYLAQTDDDARAAHERGSPADRLG